ncbi:TPA: fimbria/pilus outer membrane usher protein, partial [Citrobacter werkmanii]|nr:fimbria/pilus outer membrane usher protein [Citrobacter werkmanii]
MAKPCQGGVRPVIRKKLRRTLLALSVGLQLMSAEVWGREKLNMAFMQGGHALADTDSYATFPAGRYLVDVELNGKRTGRRILDIPPADEQMLCLTPQWLNQAGIYLREDVFNSVRDAERGCFRVAQLPDAGVEFDFTTQTLVMDIPQKGLQKKPLTTEWEYGNSALRVNYSASASHSRAGSSLSGLTSLKANLGKWILDGAASFTQDAQDINIATASRVLTGLQADLIVGRTSVGGSLLGSSNMLGATLQSNSSMQQSAVGYSPVFSGVALTPSRVTLIQGGRTIYTELLPAGPFEIRDVSLLGSNDVIMVLTDEQGRETRERIPMARLAGQINPGQQEYSFSVGMVDKDNDARGLHGGMASLSYGRGFR